VLTGMQVDGTHKATSLKSKNRINFKIRTSFVRRCVTVVNIPNQKRALQWNNVNFKSKR
jgi:hypothetical protein